MKRLLACLFLWCLVSLVEATESAANSGGILLDAVNSRVRHDPHWFGGEGERANRFGKLRREYNGSVPPQVALYLERDILIVRDKIIEGYHQGIMSRLLNGWEGVQPDIFVIIESSDRFNAYADEYGQLHITTELLRQLETEDQLAAVLAHEASHILLKHNQEKNAYNKASWTFELAGVLGVAAANMAYADNRQAKYKEYGGLAMGASQSLGFLWADMLTPAWSRSNEREADMLGLDLLIRAGYNNDAFFQVIRKLQESRSRISARQELVQATVMDTIKMGKRQTNRRNANSDVARMLGDAGFAVVTASANRFFNQVARRNVDHDSPEQREDALKTYFGEYYFDMDEPPESGISSFKRTIKEGRGGSLLASDLAALKTIKALHRRDRSSARNASKHVFAVSGNEMPSVRIAGSAVHAIERRQDQAIRELEKLMRVDYAPAESYILLSELYLNERNPNASKEVLNLGKNRIGRDYRFLPGLIYTHKRMGDTWQAEEYAIQCSRFDSRAQGRIVVRVANQGRREQSNYYKLCLRKLGYDPIARRKAEAEKQRRAMLRRLGNPASTFGTKGLQGVLDGLIRK